MAGPSGDDAPPRRASIRHWVEYVALRAFAGLVTLFPIGVGYVLARWLGSAIYAVDRRHREIARSNLRERYRDADGRPLSESEVRRIARDSFRHLVACAVEILHMPREIERRGIRDILKVGGHEHIERAIASGGGLVVATAHLGNWEVLGAFCRDWGVPFTTVYRPLDNPLLDRWIRESRAAHGQTMVPKEGALRPMVRALKSGGVVILLVDQDARSRGVFAPFFGAPASTTPTPAELALRTGATLISAVSARVGPGFRHTTTLNPPLDVSKSGDHMADLVRITSKINADIEAGVRLAPEQWLWSHRRWKTKP